MNVDRLRQVDRWIGIRLCAALTLVRRLDDLILRRAPLRKPKRIAVIKLAEQGATGVARPALLRARQAAGEDNLFFVAFEPSRFIVDLLRIVPPENVIALRTDSLLRALFDTLGAVLRTRREGIEATIDCEFFVRSTATLSYLSGARSRIGFHACNTEGAWRALVTHPLVFNLGVYPALRLAGSGEHGGSRFASGYQRDEVTMQGRMGHYTNYQAGLGLAQIDRIQPTIDRRVRNARRLIEALRDRVHFQTHDRPDGTANYMLVTALFPDMPAMAAELLKLGVDTKHHYLGDGSGLLETPQVFPNAARAEREVLHLPAHPELDLPAIHSIADKIRRAVDRVEERTQVGAHAA